MDSYLICKIPDCGQSVKKPALKAHAVTHLTNLRFRCSVCNYRAQLKKNVEMHQKYRHKAEGNIIDEKDNKYIKELESVMERCFPWEESTSGEECEEHEMSDASEYEDDRQGPSSEAFNEEPFVFEPAPNFEMLRQSKQKNMLTCQIQGCGQKINPGSNMYGLRAHAIIHHPVKRFQCTVCNYSTNAKKGVLLHQKAKHTGQGLVVDQADRRYFRTLREFTVKCFPSAVDSARKPQKKDLIDEKMIVKEKIDTLLTSIVPLSTSLRENLLSKTSDDNDNQGNQNDNQEDRDGNQEGQHDNQGSQNDHQGTQTIKEHKDLMCRIPGCEKVLSKARSGMKYLRIHAISHHPLKRFHCSMCIHASSVKKAMEAHLRGLHNGQGSVVDIADKYYYEILTAITRKCFPNYTGRNVSRRIKKVNEIKPFSEEQKGAEKEDSLKFEVSKNPDELSKLFDDNDQHLKIKDEPIFEEDAMDVESLLKSFTAKSLPSKVKQEINQQKGIPVLLLNVKDEKSPLNQLTGKVKNEC